MSAYTITFSENCVFISAKLYDQNGLSWSILPIFSQKERIVVFEMNWIYAGRVVKGHKWRYSNIGANTERQ